MNDEGPKITENGMVEGVGDWGDWEDLKVAASG